MRAMCRSRDQWIWLWLGIADAIGVPLAALGDVTLGDLAALARHRRSRGATGR